MSYAKKVNDYFEENMPHKVKLTWNKYVGSKFGDLYVLLAITHEDSKGFTDVIWQSDLRFDKLTLEDYIRGIKSLLKEYKIEDVVSIENVRNIKYMDSDINKNNKERFIEKHSRVTQSKVEPKIIKKEPKSSNKSISTRYKKIEKRGRPKLTIDDVIARKDYVYASYGRDMLIYEEKELKMTFNEVAGFRINNTDLNLAIQFDYDKRSGEISLRLANQETGKINRVLFKKTIDKIYEEIEEEENNKVRGI